ncbi:hypothetical protein DCC79_10075 [bacterium]|nr:MAG: hypothetical protein DCC79_10075 [bacterium]
MEVRDRIDVILADARLDENASEKTEAIEALIDECGWEAIRDCMLDVLRDDRLAEHWQTVANVFWGAVLDRRELPADELIAWLYHRFDPDGQADDDQVWSIASELRGVGYLSDYDALQDPAVVKHLQMIRGRGEPSAAAAHGDTARNPVETQGGSEPRPLEARDLPQGDIGTCSWDVTDSDDLLTVSNGGRTVHWGPRKPSYRGGIYPPAWVPVKTLLLLHSGSFSVDFVVDEMANAQIGIGFLLAFEGGLLDWGFFGYLGAGAFAWAYDPSTGDVVTRTESIQGGLPTFPDGRTGVVTLELELPRAEAGLARFRVQGQHSSPISLPAGAVIVPAACLLKESQRVTLDTPIRVA